jgi:hypothetical protein
MRNQKAANYFIGDDSYFINAIAYPDTPRFATAPGMYLRLDNPTRPAYFFRNSGRLRVSVNNAPRWYRNAIVFEQIFSLIFMNIHSKFLT